MRITSIDLMYICSKNDFKYLIHRCLFRFSYLKEYREFMALYATKRTLNKSDVARMKKSCDVIHEIGFDYRLTDGTALGIYRSGEFIEHDDDVDIDILNPKLRQIKEVKKVFKKRFGYKIGREVYYKNKIQQLVFYDDNGYVFDMVFWYSRGDQIENYCERGFERLQLAAYFDVKKLHYIDFYGDRYPMPSSIESWLVDRYGPDWKTPKRYKGDWKEECYDIRKL